MRRLPLATASAALLLFLTACAGPRLTFSVERRNPVTATRGLSAGSGPRPSASPSPATKPSSAATPPTQTTASSPAPVPASSPAATPTAPAQAPPLNPKEVKLVPLPQGNGIWSKMLYPEGWTVFNTISGDAIRVSKGDFAISIHTTKLEGKKPPATVDEELKVTRTHIPDATGKVIQKPGTVVAFELQYDQSPGATRIRTLTHSLYGTVYESSVSCTAPVADFPAWEPVFRQILASFNPGNLNE